MTEREACEQEIDVLKGIIAEEDRYLGDFQGVIPMWSQGLIERVARRDQALRDLGWNREKLARLDERAKRHTALAVVVVAAMGVGVQFWQAAHSPLPPAATSATRKGP